MTAVNSFRGIGYVCAPSDMGGMSRPARARNGSGSSWPNDLKLVREPYFAGYHIVNLRENRSKHYLKSAAAFYRRGFNQVGNKVEISQEWENDQRVEAMLHYRLSKFPGVAFMLVKKRNSLEAVPCVESQNDIHAIFIMETEQQLRATATGQISLVPTAVELDVLVHPDLQGREGLGAKITLAGFHWAAEHAFKKFGKPLGVIEAETYVKDFQSFWWNRLGFNENLLYTSPIPLQENPNYNQISLRTVQRDDHAELMQFLDANMQGTISLRDKERLSAYMQRLCAGEGAEMPLASVAIDNSTGKIVGYGSANVAIRRGVVALRNANAIIEDAAGLDARYVRSHANSLKDRAKIIVRGLMGYLGQKASGQVSQLGIIPGDVELEVSTARLDFWGRYFDFVQDGDYLGISTADLGRVAKSLREKVSSQWLVTDADLQAPSGTPLSLPALPTGHGAGVGGCVEMLHGAATRFPCFAPA